MSKNEVQKKYLYRLENLSKELGIDLICHEENAYFTGVISEYKFWIYDTGDSDFSSDWYDRRFEVYDFKCEEDIVTAFIDSLRDAILRKNYLREHPDRSPPPLLNRFFDWIKAMWKNPRNEDK